MFTRQSTMTTLLSTWMLLTAAALADETVMPEPNLSEGIEIAELEVTGRIDGRELALNLNFDAVTKSSQRRMLLI